MDYSQEDIASAIENCIKTSTEHGHPELNVDGETVSVWCKKDDYWYNISLRYFMNLYGPRYAHRRY